MAVKSALGAGRGRLARQLFLGSLALALGGGLVGTLVGVLGARALVALSPSQVPRLGGAHFGSASLAFTFAVATLTTLVFGLGPALSVSTSSPQRAVGDGRSSAAPSAVGARRALVAVEVALSLTLLTVAGLMVLSFARLLRVDPGFRPGGALSLRVTLPASRYTEREQLERFQGELRSRFLALPGVREAGSIQVLPLSGGLSRVDFTVEGSAPATGGGRAQRRLPHGLTGVRPCRPDTTGRRPGRPRTSRAHRRARPRPCTACAPAVAPSGTSGWARTPRCAAAGGRPRASAST